MPHDPVHGKGGAAVNTVRPGIYRHFRGAHYFVVGVGTLHDTDKTIVAYTSSKAVDNDVILFRDYADFIAPVEWPDGVTRPRFVREGYE